MAEQKIRAASKVYSRLVRARQYKYWKSSVNARANVLELIVLEAEGGAALRMSKNHTFIFNSIRYAGSSIQDRRAFGVEDWNSLPSKVHASVSLHTFDV